MPRSLDADADDDVFGSRRNILTDLCLPALLALVIIILPWYYTLYDLPPEFAVQLDPAAASTPPTSTFHGKLHASNRRATERCYGGGDAAATYGGFTVASGRVPGFCVPAKGRREVPFQLLAPTDGGAGGGTAAGTAAGVTTGLGYLPEHLRGRAADEAGKVGALELEVQIALFRHGEGGGAASSSSGGAPSRRMWCTARVAGARPPETALCTVFARQNWSDFSA